jgi:hypothetical protein
MYNGFQVGSAAVIVVYIPLCSSNNATKDKVKESDYKLR